MKKKILILVLALLFIAQSARVEAYNTTAVKEYMLNHNSSSWSVMALSVLGQTGINADHLKAISGTSAIQYAAPILAIASLDKDPRTYGSSDYVAALESYRHDGQIGDMATLNDDIFGILALVSAGEPASNPSIADAKTFLLAHQNADGGWGFEASGASDTNMTAAAILALLSAGVGAADSHIDKAIQYLKSSQNNDGGFPYAPSSGSDTASTAWVVWALNAMGISPQTWLKSGHNPQEYLEAREMSSGYFEFSDNSGEDAFSPITTAYAVIALSGQKLPIKIFSQASDEKYNFRIEGSQAQICSGRVSGKTALDIVKNAKYMCGYTYHITDMSWGLYLDQINSDVAQGLTGWLYLVNDISPTVGAADYILKKDDAVLWYYGEYTWLPLRLTLSNTEIAHGASVNAKAEEFLNGNYAPLADAAVHFGSQAVATQSNGEAVFAPADGYYEVFATKGGYIRSPRILLKAGEPKSASLSLGVTIRQGAVLGDTTSGGGQDVISFIVEPSSIDFGILNPGMSSEKNVKITNTGSTAIHLGSTVSGDEVFRDNLTVKSMPWQSFSAELQSSANESYPLKLAVPSSYTGSGNKTGQITFWAVTQ